MITIANKANMSGDGDGNFIKPPLNKTKNEKKTGQKLRRMKKYSLHGGRRIHPLEILPLYLL